MLLVDTNVWLAAADRRSDRHHDSVQLLAANRGQLAAPVPVIAESSWLILDRLGAGPHERFLNLIAGGELEPLDLARQDWARAVQLCARYRDLRLDLVDASLVAIAERLELRSIATLNRRDFTVVRPSHVDAFELLP